MLNLLQRKKLSFPSGLFDLRPSRDPCAYTGRDRPELHSFAPPPPPLLCASVAVHGQFMPTCAVPACVSALAVTPSCLHTSCFAHLGVSVKMRDCAQLAAPRCLPINVNPPRHGPFRMCPRCP